MENESESIVENESESIVENESVFDYPDKEEHDTEIEYVNEYNEDESKEGEPEEEEDDFADILRDTVSGEITASNKTTSWVSRTWGIVISWRSMGICGKPGINGASTRNRD